MSVSGWTDGQSKGTDMGILVICSYKPKAGRESEARSLMAGHVPLLRKHDLVTGRSVIQGAGRNGELVEIFEWASEEKSQSAPAVPEVGAHWKATAEVLDFVPLASLPESQQPFAHFTPIA
jgi:hypothetical protein